MHQCTSNQSPNAGTGLLTIRCDDQGQRVAAVIGFKVVKGMIVALDTYTTNTLSLFGESREPLTLATGAQQ